MKVLVTGSTAQQGSPRTASKAPTFSGLYVKALQDGGADVDFVEPSISYAGKLDEYDSVVVGIAPPTSITASKVYPALFLANQARKQNKLTLMLDAPEVYKTQAAIKSCALNLSDLSKSFYDKRKNYLDLTSNPSFSSEVFEMISHLYEEKWPTTVFPAFPWTDKERVLEALPNLSSESAVWINPDSKTLRAQYTEFDSIRKTYWTCDAPKTEWAQFTIKTLTREVVPTRKNGWELEEDTLNRMRSSVGTLVSVHRTNEPWWSVALAQSLALNVPVVTDWRHTAYMGSEWSHLAVAVDEMSQQERTELAVEQKASYLQHIPTWKETIEESMKTVATERLSFTKQL